MGAGKSAAAGRSGLALALVAGAAAAVALLASPAGGAYGEPGTVSVSYGGADYEVSYDAVGMSVVSASVDEAFESLLLGVQVGGPGSGTIEVVLERDLIDARSRDGSEDVAFIVILDGGDDAAVEETDTSADARTIKFSLPSGSEEALIVGTVLGGGGAGAPAGGAPEPAAPGPAEAQDPEPAATEPAATEPDPASPQEQPGQPEPEPFVEPGTDPVEDYVKRYATEPEYAAWFDENFGSQYGSICEAVGLDAGCVEEYNAAAAAEAAAAAAAEQQAPPAPTGPESFVDPSADPYEEYVKRYVGDAEFRAWYDESYPDRQFCDAVGLEAGCVEAYSERVAAAEAEAAAAEAEAAAAEAEAAEAAAAAAAEAEASAMQAALEQSCGEGTVLRDGACVALPPPRDPVGSGRELATGLVAAFVIALAAGVAFWIFARAGRRGRRRQRLGEDGASGGGGPDEPAPPAPDVPAPPAAGRGAAGGYDDEPRGRGTIV